MIDFLMDLWFGYAGKHYQELHPDERCLRCDKPYGEPPNKCKACSRENYRRTK